MIGEEVRRQREALGLTGAQLAARAGLAPSAVSQIETGKRTPSSTSVIKLAGALGIEVGDLFPKQQTPQPSLEDAAQSEVLQEALAVLFQGLARRGRGIVKQSEREGPSEALSEDLTEYHAETAALYRIKGGRDIFGRDSAELAEAEAAYQEVEARIQAMLSQDIDATEEERSVALRFKDNNTSYDIEEHEADAS